MECIITGSVIHGNEIGRSIGFPTANLALPTHPELTNGVYAARVEVSGKLYDALVNIGCKPTVSGEGIRLLEAHLLEFSGNLYDRILQVHLVAFIRPEQKFGSVEELRLQIEQDKQNILKILHHVS